MKVKDTVFSKKQTLNCHGRLIDLSTPKVMGILNITPDSFYDGGKYIMVDQAMDHVDVMIREGADFIDIGAYSSRPGARHIEEKEEIKRLRPVLERIRKKYPELFISLDTFRASVAKKMVDDYQIDMINDISGGEMDPTMFDQIAELQVPYILMHMQGTPQTMQKNPVYNDIVTEILDYFARKIEGLKQRGVHDVIIDPGFGFGKTQEHNYTLVQRFSDFLMLEVPVLAGVSRKSMVYKALNLKSEEALAGTISLNTLLLQMGAAILRVHDVAAAKHCIQIHQLTNQPVSGLTEKNP